MLKFVFDLDGTITSDETLPIIARAFNVHQELIQLTEDTVNGKIPWKQSFVRRVNLLKHVPVTEIDILLKKTRVYSEIVQFINDNKKDCFIATGNLDCWVDSLCKKIGCRYYSSRAIVKNNEIQEIAHILEKADVVELLQKQGHKVVFVGDSNNDVNAMRKADVAVAYGASHTPSEYCLSAADHVVYSERGLIELLTKIQKSLL